MALGNLARAFGWPPSEIEALTLRDIHFWHDQATVEGGESE